MRINQLNIFYLDKDDQSGNLLPTRTCFSCSTS